MKKSYLLNIVFITSLCILFVNDFWLKELFHNGITGKLSDVAGLIVFVLFFLAFFESRRLLVFVGTVVFFSWWKSPLSQGFIDGWNALPVFDMQRTVDYSDLICLLALVPLWFYRPKAITWNKQVEKWAFYPLTLSTAFMFFATSRMSSFFTEQMSIEQEIKVSKDRNAIKERLEQQQIVLIPTENVLFGKDTLEGYVIENLIINSDTIAKTFIGLEDRRKGGSVFVSRIEFGDQIRMIETSSYKSVKKAYQQNFENYFIGVIED